MNNDCWFEILSYCNHDDIHQLYCSCTLFQDIISHICQTTSFVVRCDSIVSDLLMYWFSIHQIPLQLFIHCVITDEMEEWFCNGKRHRDDDLPAVITKSGLKMWFQNGLYWRNGNKIPLEIKNIIQDYSLFQHILFS